MWMIKKEEQKHAFCFLCCKTISLVDSEKAGIIINLVWLFSRSMFRLSLAITTKWREKLKNSPFSHKNPPMSPIVASWISTHLFISCKHYISVPYNDCIPPESLQLMIQAEYLSAHFSPPTHHFLPSHLQHNLYNQKPTQINHSNPLLDSLLMKFIRATMQNNLTQKKSKKNF